MSSMNNLMSNVFSTEAIPLFIQDYLGEPDERVKRWMFLNSPWNLLYIYFSYAVIILGGKHFMKNRKPLALKSALIFYNIIQITSSLYVGIEVFKTAYLSGYKLSCTPLDSSNNKLALRMATLFWYFYLSKLVDLIDTVFFVFRKKNAQLTFLHIYHHSSLIFNWYLGVLYTPGGQAFFSVGVNSFVHVIMYTYYLLAAMGPKMQKYLWWKKHLTQVQLVQFIIVMLHLVYGYTNGCVKPRWLIIFTIAYLWTMIILFANFYYHSYKNKLKSVQYANESVSRINNFSEDIDVKAGGDMKIE